MSDQPTEQPTEQPADRTTDSFSLEPTGVVALRLGISRNAVLQRIKRGTLAGQKVDGVWWVVVGDNASDSTDRPSDRTTEQPTDRPYNRPTEQRDSIATSASARAQLEAIRDEWLAPLVDRIGELEREAGRLTAERDHERRRAEMAELEQAGERELREALESRLREHERQQTESRTVAENAPPANDSAPWWQFWRRE